MKKTTILLIAVLFMVIGYAAYNATINIYGNALLAENLSDFRVYLSNLKVNNTEVEGINEAKDEFTIEDINGSINIDIVNDSTEYDTEAYLDCIKEDENVGKVWAYDYTGGEQTFAAPVTGTYKLETWGAQGGSINSSYLGGYGSYAVGSIKIIKNDNIYINIGGSGTTYEYPSVVDKTTVDNIKAIGGYNGGGNGYKYWTDSLNVKQYNASGGGATHIALSSGMLANLEGEKDKILIVASGGSGAQYFYYNSGELYNYSSGASGGGVEGIESKCASNFSNAYLTDIRSASQTYGGNSVYNVSTIASGSFGQGSSSFSGGGGGFYGGSSNFGITGSGSSYIGNSLLTEKSMYCYNCTESSETSTKTISTTCTSATSTSACAKQGNGYARITLTSSATSIATDKITISAQESTSQNLKNITGKTLTCKLKVNKISRTEKKEYTGPTEWTFDYTGGEQTFTAPITGTYKLEVWGAQGGSYSKTYYGGYGGYSNGQTNLKNNETIYINIGGQGSGYSLDKISLGGYNGGGYGGVPNTNYSDRQGGSGGGGATHIAKVSGLLSSLENNKEAILIVAGGGGGGAAGDIKGSDGGGFKGNDGGYSSSFPTYHGTGGTQTIGGFDFTINSNYGTFGQGSGFSDNVKYGGHGGGGGFYGGGGTNRGHSGAGGGSGYIGNSLLTKKSMYCYNCTESSDENTRTVSTTCTNESPTENCSKQGNGFVKITLISLY